MPAHSKAFLAFLLVVGASFLSVRSMAGGSEATGNNHADYPRYEHMTLTQPKLLEKGGWFLGVEGRSGGEIAEHLGKGADALGRSGWEMAGVCDHGLDKTDAKGPVYFFKRRQP